MKTFKLLVEEIEQQDSFGYTDEKAMKLGKIAFPFKGKTDDCEFDFKKGDEIYYEYGTPIKLQDKDYTMVSLTKLICQK